MDQPILPQDRRFAIRPFSASLRSREPVERVAYSLILIAWTVCVLPTLDATDLPWTGAAPELTPLPPLIATAFQQHLTILMPDRNEAEWWAGAPSVVRDAQGTFWLAARMRSPEHPVELRGYEIRLLRSPDGLHFTPVRSIHRSELPIPGFERPALALDPRTGRFKLYVCGPWQEGPWCILKFDDVEELARIDFRTARPVIQAPERKYPRDVSVREYKDPVILHALGQWHCFVTGYVRQNERIFHFTSPDGETWEPVGEVNQPIMDLALFPLAPRRPRTLGLRGSRQRTPGARDPTVSPAR